MQFIWLIRDSLRYFGKYFIVVALFSVAAAAARAIQLGAMGDVAPFLNLCLELVTWTARIGIVLTLLGQGNAAKGVQRLRQLDFLVAAFRQKKYASLSQNARWRLVVGNTILYIMAAGGLNICLQALGNTLADHTSFWLLAKPEPIIFFLKNITIIPFTLVFVLCVVNVLLAKKK